MKRTHSTSGFTLIELIIVISMLALLATIIFFFLDPVRLIHQTRNERRRKEAVGIASAINLYHADLDVWPPIDANPVTWQMLGTATSGCDIACGPPGETVTPLVGCLNLASEFVPTYIREMPADPVIEDYTSVPGISGYAINKEGNTITVRACYTEGQERNGSGTPPLIEALQ